MMDGRIFLVTCLSTWMPTFGSSNSIFPAILLIDETLNHNDRKSSHYRDSRQTHSPSRGTSFFGTGNSNFGGIQNNFNTPSNNRFSPPKRQAAFETPIPDLIDYLVPPNPNAQVSTQNFQDPAANLLSIDDSSTRSSNSANFVVGFPATPPLSTQLNSPSVFPNTNSPSVFSNTNLPSVFPNPNTNSPASSNLIQTFTVQNSNPSLQAPFHQQKVQIPAATTELTLKNSELTGKAQNNGKWDLNYQAGQILSPPSARQYDTITSAHGKQNFEQRANDVLNDFKAPNSGNNQNSNFVNNNIPKILANSEPGITRANFHTNNPQSNNFVPHFPNNNNNNFQNAQPVFGQSSENFGDGKFPRPQTSENFVDGKFSRPQTYQEPNNNRQNSIDQNTFLGNSNKLHGNANNNNYPANTNNNYPANRNNYPANANNNIPSDANIVQPKTNNFHPNLNNFQPNINNNNNNNNYPTNENNYPNFPNAFPANINNFPVNTNNFPNNIPQYVNNQHNSRNQPQRSPSNQAAPNLNPSNDPLSLNSIPQNNNPNNQHNFFTNSNNPSQNQQEIFSNSFENQQNSNSFAANNNNFQNSGNFDPKSNEVIWGATTKPPSSIPFLPTPVPNVALSTQYQQQPNNNINNNNINNNDNINNPANNYNLMTYSSEIQSDSFLPAGTVADYSPYNPRTLRKKRYVSDYNADYSPNNPHSSRKKRDVSDYNADYDNAPAVNEGEEHYPHNVEGENNSEQNEGELNEQYENDSNEIANEEDGSSEQVEQQGYPNNVESNEGTPVDEAIENTTSNSEQDTLEKPRRSVYSYVKTNPEGHFKWAVRHTI